MKFNQIFLSGSLALSLSLSLSGKTILLWNKIFSGINIMIPLNLKEDNPIKLIEKVSLFRNEMYSVSLSLSQKENARTNRFVFRIQFTYRTEKKTFFFSFSIYTILCAQVFFKQKGLTKLWCWVSTKIENGYTRNWVTDCLNERRSFGPKTIQNNEAHGY